MKHKNLLGFLSYYFYILKKIELFCCLCFKKIFPCLEPENVVMINELMIVATALLFQYCLPSDLIY